jgi:hypothetical protein
MVYAPPECFKEGRMTSARRKQNPVAELRREMPTGVFRARRRRKSLRQHFREGLEYGLKAEPTAFAAAKPRTMMGLMIRELVCAAASARCDQVDFRFRRRSGIAAHRSGYGRSR